MEYVLKQKFYNQCICNLNLILTHASMRHRVHASIRQRVHASIRPCFHWSLCPCVHVSMRSYVNAFCRYLTIPCEHMREKQPKKIVLIFIEF